MNILKTKNKWLSGAIPALLIHCCIGSVYCWSLIKNEIAYEIGVYTSSIEIAFSLAIFFLGMSAAFFGRFIEKNVKISSLISAICFVVGLFLTTISMRLHNVNLLFIGYGVVMGIGLGIGYLSPVKTLMLWFNKHKGMATGIAISGFGLSKVILSPFIEWCNTTYSVYTTLYVIMGVSLVLMLIASLLIQKPYEWHEDVNKLSFNESIKILCNSEYIKIWLIFYLNITAGLALLAFEKDICLDRNITAIAIVSSLTAFFNTIGRFGYSSFSDKLKDRKTAYLIIFTTSLIACFVYGSVETLFAISSVVILLCVVNAGYGGGFSTLPTLLQSRFGMDNISTIHGFALSAWAWAGLSGNQLSNYVINQMNYSYEHLVSIIACLYAISLIISLSIKKPHEYN